MAGSLLVGGMPYERPHLRSFFGTRSAWAQPSGPTTLTLQGQLGTRTPGVGENTGSDWWSLDVLSAGTTLTITATSDNFLDIELFLFAPGVSPTIGTNLLTNSFAPHNTQGLTAGEMVSLTLGGPGLYTLAIEDTRPPSTETAGLYSIEIVSDQPLGAASMIADENPEIQAPAPAGSLNRATPERPNSG